ncbi:endonuclease-reverse transcriptase [Plakobranchus ocellatus]|uniref:Endonuclease-reverse transcriptase n=1 Tax=Plakobranchus ocellatus TaxID=259542 RepID=A0AAV4D973_9GAST|nr:endonuclease-reverse transcriptase [Plakobranchus ocellatus]
MDTKQATVSQTTNTPRAMQRKMLNIKLKDRIPTIEIRKKTQVIDVVQHIQRQKWRWTGHNAREKDNRWTKSCTEWQPRSGRRDRGRPEARWMDVIRRAAGPQWQRKAQDRRKWKTSAEGYILQWMNKASKKPSNQGKRNCVLFKFKRKVLSDDINDTYK